MSNSIKYKKIIKSKSDNVIDYCLKISLFAAHLRISSAEQFLALYKL